MQRPFIMIACMSMLSLLSACADNQRDYAASQHCLGLGHKTGTPEYDRCMRDERATRLMEQNKREFEERKADEEYWRSRRGLYRM